MIFTYYTLDGRFAIQLLTSSTGSKIVKPNVFMVKVVGRLQ